MKFRKLRIAWSALCGIACVLLVVLWVRSHWWLDQVTIPITKTQSLQPGLIVGGVRFLVRYNLATADAWGWHTFALEKIKSTLAAGIVLNGHRIWEGHCVDWGCHSGMGFDEAYLLVPYWLLTTAVAALAAAPWLKWKFSLRTLLIITTLVAVVLGAIAYTSR